MARESEPARSVFIFFLLFLFQFQGHVSGLSIGVNYGTLGNNLPPPPQVAKFLKEKTFIDRVKLFDANPAILSAFANTNISVAVSIANSDIPALAARRSSAAADWVAANIIPFHPATRFSYVLVGNEVLATADRSLIAHLLPAMRALHAALRGAGITSVGVTTPNSLGILSASDPPSVGRFRRGYDRAIFAKVLEFHNQTGSPFMINPYPYFGYSPKNLDYALFRPNKGLKDPATGALYMNMFDAQMDAVFWAMKKVGYGAGVNLVVGETGWPSAAEPGQAGVGVEEAAAYNGGLIRHVNSGKGTPMMPGRRFETYVFSLFNENLKPGPIAERNFGLFNPDLNPVYDVGLMRDGGQVTPMPTPPSGGSGAGKKWCVARAGSNEQTLQHNIDYACSNGVDCSPIEEGGKCFNPNTILGHATYAMNAYYQSHGRNNFDCDFARTGVIIDSDPSYDDCQFNA